MSRELKFRAWDNVKSEMYYVGESEEVAFAFDSNGITATDLTEHDWGFKQLEHLEYMQFTGLYDKNGTPIYEGDIIQWDAKEWGKPYKETVVWDYDLFSSRQGDWKQFCEVIGDIYAGEAI